MRFVLCLTVLFAACSSDDSKSDTDAPVGPTPDAPSEVDAYVPDVPPPAHLACLGDDYPNTAPATITISGAAAYQSNSGQLTALGDANIKILGTSGGLLNEHTTDNTGQFAISVPTSGVAVEGYIHGTHNNYIDSYVFPPYAMWEDFSSALVLFTNRGQIDLITLIAGADNWDPTKGIVAVRVSDCDNQELAGASISTPAGLTPIYMNGNFPSSTATATDDSGLAFFVNAEPGSFTVNVTSAEGFPLRPNVFEARGGALNTTVVVP